MFNYSTLCVDKAGFCSYTWEIFSNIPPRSSPSCALFDTFVIIISVMCVISVYLICGPLDF